MTTFNVLEFTDGMSTVSITPTNYSPSFEGGEEISDGFLSPSIKATARRYSFQATTIEGDLTKFDALIALQQTQSSGSTLTCNDYCNPEGSDFKVRVGLLKNVGFNSPSLKIGDGPSRVNVSGGLTVTFEETDRNY